MKLSIVVAVLGLAACREKAGETEVSTTSMTGAELPTIATVSAGARRTTMIAGDGTSARPIVFLHDACIDPKTDLGVWGLAARNLGTVLAPEGDASCPDGSSTWTEDADQIDRRVQGAIDAGAHLDRKAVVLVGSGIGAARAELLAKRFPDRYTRVVLIGAPAAPSTSSFSRARAVATLAGDDEPLYAMKDGSRVLDRAGISSQHWTFPGAAHGQYGAEGSRMMHEAITFVATR